MPAEGRALTSGMLLKEMRIGEWHEPIDTQKDSDSPEEALLQGEGGEHMMPTLGTIFCVSRRVPCGEASRKAVCGKTACTV